MRRVAESDFRLAERTTSGRREFLACLRPSRGDVISEDEAGGFWIRLSRRAMACRFEITLAAEDAGLVSAARAALDDIDTLEEQLSVFRKTSAISDLNRHAADGPVVVQQDLFELLATCERLHRETDRAFDITTTPLSRCWGFMAGVRSPAVGQANEGGIPEMAALEAARAAVGFDAVQLDRENHTVTFSRRGAELNLGAIGKGYALDHAAVQLRTAGGTHALLSAGRSSLLALGGRGRGWRIDLVSPLVKGRAIAGLWLRNAALGTSGAGEQFVTANGRRYGHVIDPRTGWPARGLLSATVVASDATVADALSTAFLIGGIELADRYCTEHPPVLALITPDDGSERPVVLGSHPGAHILERGAGAES
jgi:thiamine biosynthesis lipoprotein